MNTGFTTDRIGAYTEKDPQATLDYTIDWDLWVSTGDTIASSQWAIETITGDANPLVMTTDSFDNINNTTTVWIADGSISNQYRITNTITTTNGLTDERYFRIFVKDRSA